ncbi:MAG: hypothetical protein JRL30_09525 [Deltaproteobacteria bacterium]|nr:hypothetical protein [Deltaproteobacteria bacterium]
MPITLSELISSISSVAALVTAIIVFFTLLEMIRQRQSSYKPDLVFKPLRFSVSADTFDTLQYTISTEDSGDNSEQGHHDPNGKVFNIGLGSAKNLRFTWQFDHEKAIERVKKLNVELGLTTNVKDKILIIKAKTSSVYISLENDFLQSIDYLLPVSITNQPVIMQIPSCYVNLLSIYSIYQICKNADDALHALSSFPRARVTTEYKDVGGKIYKKKYSVNSRYHHIEWGGGDDGTLPRNIKFSIFLEFTEL